MFVKGAKNGVAVEFTLEEKPSAVIFNKIGEFAPEGKRWWVNKSDDVIIDSHEVSNTLHTVTGRVKLCEMDIVKDITLQPSTKSFVLVFKDIKDSANQPDIKIERLDLE